MDPVEDWGEIFRGEELEGPGLMTRRFWGYRVNEKLVGKPLGTGEGSPPPQRKRNERKKKGKKKGENEG